MVSVVRMVSSSLYKSKAAVFADLWLFLYSIQLNIFERMTKSTPASVTNRRVAFDFYHGNSRYLCLGIASEQSEVRLKQV